MQSIQKSGNSEGYNCCGILQQFFFFIIRNSYLLCLCLLLREIVGGWATGVRGQGYLLEIGASQQKKKPIVRAYTDFALLKVC